MSPTNRKASLVLSVFAIAAVLALAMPGSAEADEPFTFTLIAEGSFGGPLQERSGGDAGLDNGGFQLGFSVIGTGEVHVGGRVGSLDFDESLGGLGDASLDYIHVGGDYRFHEGFYSSGIYLGLGHYEVEGTNASGVVETENSLGLAVGVTGEFELNKKIGLMLELTSHITDLSTAELFLTAHVGLAVHF